MVTRAVARVRSNRLDGIAPSSTPRRASTNENSPTWARLRTTQAPRCDKKYSLTDRMKKPRRVTGTEFAIWREATQIAFSQSPRMNLTAHIVD